MPAGSVTINTMMTQAVRKFKETLTEQFARASRRFDMKIDLATITVTFNDDIIIANGIVDGFDKIDLSNIEKGVKVGLVYYKCFREDSNSEDDRPLSPGFYAIFVKGMAAELHNSAGKTVFEKLPIEIKSVEATDTASPTSELAIAQIDTVSSTSGLTIAQDDIQVSYAGGPRIIRIDTRAAMGPAGGHGDGRGIT